MEVLGVIVAIIAIYLVVNRKRNSDPLNRKCAAEICTLIVSGDNVTSEEIAEIFMSNARYNKQAGHIVSMVPALLIEEGLPKNFAMSTVPLLRTAQMMIPK